jgi:hypothetical protein
MVAKGSDPCRARLSAGKCGLLGRILEAHVASRRNLKVNVRRLREERISVA